MRRWPHDAHVHLALGNRAHAAGHDVLAVSHYRTGLRYAPCDVVLSNNMASVLGELGCTGQARTVLDAAVPGDGRWNAQLAQTRRELAARSAAAPSRCRLSAGRNRD